MQLLAKFEKNLYIGFRATLKFWKLCVVLNRSIVVIVQRIREQENVVILCYSMQIESSVSLGVRPTWKLGFTLHQF